MIAPQPFLEEEVFNFKITNPNLEDGFYLLFQNLVYKDVSVQSVRRALTRRSKSIISHGWTCRHLSCQISPYFFVPYSGEYDVIRILAEGTSETGKKGKGHSQNQCRLGISSCNSDRNLLKH